MARPSLDGYLVLRTKRIGEEKILVKRRIPGRKPEWVEMDFEYYRSHVRWPENSGGTAGAKPP